jgi:hypothetical protein
MYYKMYSTSAGARWGLRPRQSVQGQQHGHGRAPCGPKVDAETGEQVGVVVASASRVEGGRAEGRGRARMSGNEHHIQCVRGLLPRPEPEPVHGARRAGRAERVRVPARHAARLEQLERLQGRIAERADAAVRRGQRERRPYVLVRVHVHAGALRVVGREERAEERGCVRLLQDPAA